MRWIADPKQLTFFAAIPGVRKNHGQCLRKIEYLYVKQTMMQKKCLYQQESKRRRLESYAPTVSILGTNYPLQVLKYFNLLIRLFLYRISSKEMSSKDKYISLSQKYRDRTASSEYKQRAQKGPITGLITGHDVHALLIDSALSKKMLQPGDTTQFAVIFPRSVFPLNRFAPERMQDEL